MKVRIMHSAIGECWLTDEHPASSYGQPVIVDDNGAAYGPRDISGYIHKACKPRHIVRYDNTVPVYDDDERQPIDYTTDEIAWVEDLYLDHITTRGATTWAFGASWESVRINAAVRGLEQMTKRMRSLRLDDDTE